MSIYLIINDKLNTKINRHIGFLIKHNVSQHARFLSQSNAKTCHKTASLLEQLKS